MEIRIANECDIDGWMNLVSKVKNSFSGLETKEDLDGHRDTVLDFIPAIAWITNSVFRNWMD